jgi:hypothetical protein
MWNSDCYINNNAWTGVHAFVYMVCIIFYYPYVLIMFSTTDSSGMGSEVANLICSNCDIVMGYVTNSPEGLSGVTEPSFST